MDIKLINESLDTGLDDIKTPVSGIYKINKILESYGINIPNLYDLDEDCGEILIEFNENGEVIISEDITEDTNFLHILYQMNEDNIYDFYAKIIDFDQTKEMIQETGLLELELDDLYKLDDE